MTLNPDIFIEVVKRLSVSQAQELDIKDDPLRIYWCRYARIDLSQTKPNYFSGGELLWLVHNSNINKEQLFKYLIDNDRPCEFYCLLKQDLVEPDLNDNLAIRWAAGKGYYKIISFLLKDLRVNPNAEYKQPEPKKEPRCYRRNLRAEQEKWIKNFKFIYLPAIIQAAANGHTKIVKLLLVDERVDPSIKNSLALFNAIASNHIEIVKLLLANKRIDLTADNNYACSCQSEALIDAIRTAAANGHLEIVKLLLNNKLVNPVADDNNALCAAIAGNHIDIVKFLLADDRVKPERNNLRIILALMDPKKRKERFELFISHNLFTEEILLLKSLEDRNLNFSQLFEIFGFPIPQNYE